MGRLERWGQKDIAKLISKISKKKMDRILQRARERTNGERENK